MYVKEESKFDCRLERQFLSDEKKYGITDAFKYQTLQQGLIRLKTHPVAANLTCFDNWEDFGIYKDSREKTEYRSEHKVLMLDCIEFEVERVIRCKASNGEDTGNRGYLYVSPEVMMIVVGGARKKNGTSAIERNPEDHDALYNRALILQESADNFSPDSVSPSKDELLKEACKKYDEATRLCPTLYDAYYNWAIAISDRAKMRGRTKEAEVLWEQATNNYEKAVQLNWKSSQALNNWGLALQELSQILPATEKEEVVRTAISKFRAAIRLQFDFHGAIFNLGTILYGLAEDTLRTGGVGDGKDMPPGELYSQSAIYIAAAHSLKPSHSVYSSVLRLVHSMLPLPHLKVGYLTAPPVGNSIAPHNDWKRTEFELNHERLLQVMKPEPREMGRNLSGKSEAMNTNVEKKTVKVNITEIVSVTPCADLSLPPGAGLCIDTIHGLVFLVADSWESLDGWLDAIRLVYTVNKRGKSDVLAGIITA